MISAILLAAGQSKRMNGENKLTKKIHGMPMINHCVKNILNSSIDEIIIVLGYQNEIIEKLVEKNKKVKFIFNKNFKRGIASSIKSGLYHLSKETKYFFICLGDMPNVKSNIYNQLIQSKNKKEIIIPTFNGRQGNPVLFSINTKEMIMNVNGDTGAKRILEINNEKILNLEINDFGITQDYNSQDNFNF